EGVGSPAGPPKQRRGPDGRGPEGAGPVRSRPQPGEEEIGGQPAGPPGRDHRAPGELAQRRGPDGPGGGPAGHGGARGPRGPKGGRQRRASSSPVPSTITLVTSTLATPTMVVSSPS